MSLLLKRLFSRLQTPVGEDGSDLPGGEDIIGSNNDARVALLNQIGDSKDALTAEEFAEVGDDGEVIIEEPEETPVKEEVDRYKIKVNGEEKELTIEELIARAQKVESADVYLAEAARLRREALEEQKKVPSGPSEEDIQNNLLEERRALARAIQMGTEEEAVEAIAKLQQSSRAPSFTKDELTRTVDERLSFQEAVNQFRSNYADIVDDSVLAQMAAQRDQELLASGDRRGYLERYTAIGDDIRSWVKGIKGDEPRTQDKQTRKASAKGVPSAASVKSKPASSDDDVEESTSEVIAAMAKNRGGPQWARA